MKQRSNLRAVLRWIHLTLAIPIVGYIYSPFKVIPSYAGPTRFVFFPLLVLTGLGMWKGHIVLTALSNLTKSKRYRTQDAQHQVPTVGTGNE